MGARSIVNGLDKAKLIAVYYKHFMDAIVAARDLFPPKDATKADDKADDKPAGQSGTMITTVLVPAAAGACDVDCHRDHNVYALIFTVTLLEGSIVAELFLSGRWQTKRSNAT